MEIVFKEGFSEVFEEFDFLVEFLLYFFIVSRHDSGEDNSDDVDSIDYE